MDSWFNLLAGIIFILISWSLITSFVYLLDSSLVYALNLDHYLKEESDNKIHYKRVNQLFVLTLIYLAVFLIMLYFFDVSLFQVFGIDTQNTVFDFQFSDKYK